MFLKFAPAIKSENAGNTFYDQFYCCTFTMFKNNLTLNFAFSLKKTYGNTAILGFHKTSPKFKLRHYRSLWIFCLMRLYSS